MDNAIVTIETLRAGLKRELEQINSITNYSVKEIVSLNMDVIDEFLENGITLKEVCERFNNNGTKLNYKTFAKWHKIIKEGVV